MFNVSFLCKMCGVHLLDMYKPPFHVYRQTFELVLLCRITQTQSDCTESVFKFFSQKIKFSIRVNFDWAI